MKMVPMALLSSGLHMYSLPCAPNMQTQTCKCTNIHTLIATMWMWYVCNLPLKGKSEVNRNGVFTIFASQSGRSYGKLTFHTLKVSMSSGFSAIYTRDRKISQFFQRDQRQSYSVSMWMMRTPFLGWWQFCRCPSNPELLLISAD